MLSEAKGSLIVRSVLTGIGMMILFLLLGTVLDYLVTQALSQFFIPNCSENCYFDLFNSIFVIIVLISLAVGVRSGVRTYRRLSN